MRLFTNKLDLQSRGYRDKQWPADAECSQSANPDQLRGGRLPGAGPRSYPHGRHACVEGAPQDTARDARVRNFARRTSRLELDKNDAPVAFSFRRR